MKGVVVCLGLMEARGSCRMWWGVNPMVMFSVGTCTGEWKRWYMQEISWYFGRESV